MKALSLKLLSLALLSFPLLLTAEEKKPLEGTHLGWEGALTLKENEAQVKYGSILNEKLSDDSLSNEECKVVVGVTHVFNFGTRAQYKTLEILVTDPKNGDRIAFQRQYAQNFEALNNTVMEFKHPRTGQNYVLGVRNAENYKRLTAGR